MINLVMWNSSHFIVASLVIWSSWSRPCHTVLKRLLAEDHHVALLHPSHDPGQGSPLHAVTLVTTLLTWWRPSWCPPQPWPWCPSACCHTTLLTWWRPSWCPPQPGPWFPPHAVTLQLDDQLGDGEELSLYCSLFGLLVGTIMMSFMTHCALETPCWGPSCCPPPT